MSANDSVQRSSGLDVVPRLRLCVIEANSERWKTAFQLDGTVLGTLSGIELGFDSSVDLNGESGLWKFVRTWSHAEVQNFCVVVQWLLWSGFADKRIHGCHRFLACRHRLAGLTDRSLANADTAGQEKHQRGA